MGITMNEHCITMCCRCGDQGIGQRKSRARTQAQFEGQCGNWSIDRNDFGQHSSIRVQSLVDFSSAGAQFHHAAGKLRNGDAGNRNLYIIVLEQLLNASSTSLAAEVGEQGGGVQQAGHAGSWERSSTSSPTADRVGENLAPAPISRRESARRSGTMRTTISSGRPVGDQSNMQPGLISNILASSAGMEIMFFVVTVVVME